MPVISWRDWGWLLNYNICLSVSVSVSLFICVSMCLCLCVETDAGGDWRHVWEKGQLHVASLLFVVLCFYEVQLFGFFWCFLVLIGSVVKWLARPVVTWGRRAWLLCALTAGIERGLHWPNLSSVTSCS